MATQPHTVSPMLPIETPQELDFPQREAAFFYGLFLRGHSPEQLRRDISVPPQVAAKWGREAERRGVGAAMGVILAEEPGGVAAGFSGP